MAIDAPGDFAVVDRYHWLAQDVLDDHDRFGEAHMGEGGGSHEGAHRVHTGFACAVVIIDDHESALVDLDLGARQEEPIGERTAADRDHHQVHIYLLALAEMHGR